MSLVHSPPSSATSCRGIRVTDLLPQIAEYVTAAATNNPVKCVLVRAPADLHRDLKMLAVRRAPSIQALILGTIQEMIAPIHPAR